MPEIHKRRLRNYLLDRKLQLQYTAIIVLISALLTSGLGYFWYSQVRETSMTVEVQGLETLSMSEAKRIKAEMQSDDRLQLMVLIGFGILFALIVAGYGIMLTHKVAGPLFKISKYMTDIKEGRLGMIYDLRRGDQIQDFYATFKEMHLSLRKTAQDEVTLLNKVMERIEHLASSNTDVQADEIEHSLKFLRELRDRKQTSLES